MKKSLAINSLYNILYKVVTALYPLVAVTYVSHVLLSDKTGMVSYAQNISSYFYIFAALGIPTYGTRELAKCAESKDRRSKLFYELFCINAVSTTLSTIAYLILVLKVERFSSNLPLYLIAGLHVVLNYINVDWFYQGMEEYKYISIRSMAIKVISFVLLPIMVRKPDDYLNYALIYSLAIAGNNVLNIIRIRRYISLKKYELNIKRHLKPIAILLIASLAVEIYVMIDTTMLGIFCDDSTVGCYSNAMKLTRTVNTMAAAIGAVLLPRLSVIYINNIEEFNKLVNAGIKIMLMVAIPAALGIILLSDHIVLLFFGTTFLDAIPILRILAFMIPIVVCNTLLGGQVLITANMELKYVISVTIASLANISLNALLIPRYGAPSAAVASLISELIDLALYLLFIRKFVKIHFSVRDILSTFVPLALFASLSIYIFSNINTNHLIILIINIASCLVIYFGLGLCMRNESMLFVKGKMMQIIHNRIKSRG